MSMRKNVTIIGELVRSLSKHLMKQISFAV